ncbi:MAG: NAD-dependent epimerase/dehydratase family protein [Deltaproteobacteria bacterium]|jgi:nucleoside-diphosphate-sugar epimerase|nr:NAD-dependent epimerase/dehydratase family protein [Deltaproteobacteria bacterium]
MRILIIGGTGFVGLALSKRLASAGHEIALFHRTLDSFLPFRQIRGDLGNSDELRGCLESVRPECVIHTMAMNGRHVAALENALAAPARVVIVSSGDVYKAFEILSKLSGGPVGDAPLAETAPLRSVRYFCRYNDDEYEKIDVEAAALASRAIEPVIVRLGMVFGLNDPNRRFYDKIEAAKRGAITLPANLAAWRACYAGVRNVAHGIALAAEKWRGGEIYNLADETVYTELEWSRIIAALMSLDVPITVSAENSQTLNYAQNLVLDTAKIRRELGYVEPFSPESHLLEMIKESSA